MLDQGIEVTVAGEPLPLRELKLVSELTDLIQDENAYAQVSDAVAAFMARKNREGEKE